MQLDLLRDLIPNGQEKVPKSFYFIKNIIGNLGFCIRKEMHAQMVVCFIVIRRVTCTNAVYARHRGGV